MKNFHFKSIGIIKSLKLKYIAVRWKIERSLCEEQRARASTYSVWRTLGISGYESRVFIRRRSPTATLNHSPSSISNRDTSGIMPLKRPCLLLFYKVGISYPELDCPYSEYLFVYTNAGKCNHHIKGKLHSPFW